MTTRNRRFHALALPVAGVLALTGVGVATAASAPAVSAEAAASQALRGLTLEEKVGQLFVTWVNGKSADEVALSGTLR